ncbi:DUF1206 domain-containing protein [Terribacillus halophilus]|nr:DUF1206 domain-containing protein [Terribacillus halophilus]
MNFSVAFPKFHVSFQNSGNERTGCIDLISRGIVFGVVGSFFILTAIQSGPDKEKGLDGARAEVSQQPFGRWLLGIVSSGFILFGVSASRRRWVWEKA